MSSVNSENPIEVNQYEGWTKISLNRPDKLNAFNDEMHVALAQALKDCEDESCRAVLITGNGRGFCAGQDLSMRAQSMQKENLDDIDLGTTITVYYNPLIKRIKTLQKPVICAVNGVAAGAGANIALACDIVLAAKSAKFIQAFAKIGLIPDSGGTYFLPRLIGEARARALIMTGEPLMAEQAEAWGMIWKAYDDDKLQGEAEKLTAFLSTQPTQGLALAKDALNLSATHSLDEQLDIERNFQQKAGKTPDYREGVTAFMEKRPANFTGKK